MHEHALAWLHPGRAVKQLVCGSPAQDQRRRLGRVHAIRNARHVVGTENAPAGVRSDDRHVGHALTEPKIGYAFAKLIDFSDHVIAERERRLSMYRLRVEMTPDHDVGVHDA